LKVLELLDLLEEEIESGGSLPLTGKKLLDPDKLLDIIDELREALPGEIRQAEILKQERERILEDAQKDAATLVAETQARMTRMVNEHEITQQAYQQSQEIINTSESNAQEIRSGAIAYADDILSELQSYMNQYQTVIADYIQLIESNRQQLKQEP
jgi:cell division septum initiation protein DivIVA